MFADGARWVLVLVFCLAALEKTGTLLSRSSAWHPAIVASAFLRRHATVMMLAALAADVAAVGLLLIKPAAGGVASAMLVVGYSRAGLRAHTKPHAEGCRCLWRFLNTSTRGGLLVRNALLLLLAALVSSAPGRTSIASFLSAIGTGVALAALTGIADRRYEAYASSHEYREGSPPQEGRMARVKTRSLTVSAVSVHTKTRRGKEGVAEW
jgi:hypothetical protein